MDWGSDSWPEFLCTFGDSMVFASLYLAKDIRMGLKMYKGTEGMDFGHRKDLSFHIQTLSQPVKAGEFPREFLVHVNQTYPDFEEPTEIRIPYLDETKSVDTTALVEYLREQINDWKKRFSKCY